MENDDDAGGKGKAVEKREFEESVSRPVSPGESGEGLPYAPQHWPNPGDIWVWRVGYRFSKEGIFHDRYLRIPQRLRESQTRLPLEFQSKPAVERYLRSKFPEADISAFFASFTWVIRVKPELIGKYVHIPRTRRAPVKKLEKNRGDRVSKRMQKAVKTPKEAEMSSDIAAVDGEETPAASSSFLVSQFSGDFNVSQANNNLDSPIDCKQETNTLFKKSRGDPSPEEFDNYLRSLDEILDSPLSMHQSSSSSMEEDMLDLRKKLSSLLAMGTPISFLSSENVDQLIALSYKLQNDPNLSKEELSILKLIQTIPFISKSFVEAKEISSKVDEFLGVLNAKIVSVASLKEEYNASKEEMEAVKADEASTLLDIMDIDQEISKLEKLRQEKAERIKANGEKLIHLNSIQKTVMGSLPKVVNEVQMAKSEKSIWEHKKKKAAEMEDEILARFAPLEGFSF